MVIHFMQIMPLTTFLALPESVRPFSQLGSSQTTFLSPASGHFVLTTETPSVWSYPLVPSVSPKQHHNRSSSHRTGRFFIVFRHWPFWPTILFFTRVPKATQTLRLSPHEQPRPRIWLPPAPGTRSIPSATIPRQVDHCQ